MAFWPVFACDDEVCGLTTLFLGNHEGGGGAGICVGIKESWRLVQYVPYVHV